MNKVNTHWGILFAVMSLSACGQHKPTAARWRNTAPQSQQEAGIVVQLDNENQALSLRSHVEEIMQQNENVEVREISQAHGMYEFHNISKAELMKNLNAFDVHSYQNVFFRNLIPQAKKQPLAQLKTVNVDSCLEGDKQPTADIAPTSQITKLNSIIPIVDLKDGAVSFTSKASISNQPDKTLEKLWLVQGPQGSTYEHKVIEAPVISFQPDIPGAYTVSLIVQDTDRFCDVKSFEFGATYNVAFAGAKPPRAFNMTKDRARFFHLDEIGAIDAWNTAPSKGSNVIIAIVDSGVNYNHPDLAANILVNSKEIPGNKFDDDGNGKADDVTGWDFFSNDNMPVDDNMHGTHVAGLAASAVSGVAPSAKILPVKVMSAFGSGDLASITAGIRYAADRGANIINISLGADTFGMDPQTIKKISTEWEKAITYSQAKGAIVVAAAGNGYPYDPSFGPLAGQGFDIDKTTSLPASLLLNNLVTVSAVDSFGTLTDYSNFGSKAVLVAAPGGASDTNPNDKIDDSKPLLATYFMPSIASYVGLEGTSMATPVVSGALALMKSAYPKAKMAELISALSSSVVKKSALTGKVKSGGVINVPQAFKSLALLPPGIANKPH